MKILLLNTVPTENNGITNVLFNYLRAMETDGLQIDLVSINHPDEYYLKEVERKGGQVYVLARLDGTITYWRYLRNLIREKKYDAIHIHGNSHTTLLELTAAKVAGCNIRIVHAHNTMCKHVILHKLLSPIFKLLCTHCLACGKDSGMFMFGNKPFTIVNNGVDIEKFAFHQEKRDFIRQKLGFEGCKVIGHVGSFIEVKNHQWIIEVFRELVRNDNTYRLVLIGDGELRESIVAKVKKYEISDFIIFTGNINNVDSYLCAMDLILMPSLYEGLPLALIEQQVNGLRCVLADTITKEVDKTGNITFLSLSSLANDWAKTIEQIEIVTDGKRKTMSDNAVYAITNCGYSIKDEAAKLKKYYLQAINQ